MGAAYHGHTRLLIDMSPFKFEGPGGEGRKPWVHVLPCPDPYRRAPTPSRAPRARGQAGGARMSVHRPGRSTWLAHAGAWLLSPWTLAVAHIYIKMWCSRLKEM